MTRWTFLAIFALTAHGIFSQNTTVTTSEATTGSLSTSSVSTTGGMTTAPSSTGGSTTALPTTSPSTASPTTQPSTTGAPSTASPTTQPSTTGEPTTASPTTPPPMTTPAPGSTTWIVNSTQGPCIMLKMEALFVLPEGSNTTLPATASVVDTKSTCSGTNSTQVITLSFEAYFFTITFIKDKICGGDKKFCANEISLNETGPGIIYSAKEPLLQARTSYSYFCKAETSFNLTSADNKTVAVTLTNVQAEAFLEKTSDFGPKEECTADDRPNDIVPIAVGCALAGLVIIVLIAYLVGRRRNRQKGYQSV